MSDPRTAPYDPEPRTPSAETDSRPQKNGWGLAALITGLVALLAAAIPVVNYFVGIVALAGIGLGIAALVVKNRRRGAGIAGIVISVIALLLAVTLAIVYTVIGVQYVSDLVRDLDLGDRPASTALSSEVIYEVAGDGGSAAIQYIDFDENGSVEIESEETADLPFDETVEVPLDSTGAATEEVGVSAVADDSTSTLRCRIIAEGMVIDEQTDTGPGAEVTCTAGG